jgi:hypothetical protein
VPDAYTHGNLLAITERDGDSESLVISPTPATPREKRSPVRVAIGSKRALKKRKPDKFCQPHSHFRIVTSPASLRLTLFCRWQAEQPDSDWKRVVHEVRRMYAGVMKVYRGADEIPPRRIYAAFTSMQVTSSC